MDGVKRVMRPTGPFPVLGFLMYWKHAGLIARRIGDPLDLHRPSGQRARDHSRVAPSHESRKVRSEAADVKKRANGAARRVGVRFVGK